MADLSLNFSAAGFERIEMTTDQQARLAVELEYFCQHKAEWLALKSGQYVVIKECTPLGFYQTFEAAYWA